MTAARCRCRHTHGQHYRDRKGRALCVDPCGCTEFRPDDGNRWPPARFDERYDPSPDGVDRRTR